MAQILIRGLDPVLVERLKERAKRNRRTLQAEVKALLEEAGRPTMTKEKMLAMHDKWMEHWKKLGKTFSDSAELIREDRDSR